MKIIFERLEREVKKDGANQILFEWGLLEKFFREKKWHRT